MHPSRLLRHVTALVSVLTVLATAPAQAGICRVTPEGTGNGSGADWNNTASLSGVLDGVSPALAACTEIWLKQGVYLPPGNSRAATFLIDRPLALYGGFNGNELIREGRTLTSEFTVLSGDIGTLGVASDNAYHVVTLNGATRALQTSNTVLDNITIAWGNANGDSLSQTDQGGGVFCQYNCSPTFNNVTFRDNNALRGGAFFHTSVTGAYASRPIVSNSTFHNNSADYGGAWVSAGDGGGLTASASFDNTTFANNIAAQSGGALYIQGANGGTSNVTLTHVTLAGNQATAVGGGAFTVYGVAGTATASIRNSILTGNVGASAANANIYLFYSSTVTIDTSNVTGGCPVGVTCTNSMDYVVALQPLDWNGGPTQTMMLGVNSASIDRAANATCLPIDQRGYVRPQGAKCDLGAVERRVFPFSVSVIGNGSVSSSIAGNIANCTASGGQCGTTHDGDTVPPISFDLIAMPAVGYYPQWGGDCVGAGTNLTSGVTMNAPRSCTVTFYPTAIGFSVFVTGVSPPNGINLELQSPAISGGENIYTQIGGQQSFSSRLSVGTPYTLVVTPSAGFNCHLLGNPPASGIAPRHNLSFNVDCSTPPSWPACSLDVNGDGRFDQADARSIAAWLFGMRGTSLYAAAQPSNGRDANALDQFIGAQVAVQNYDLDADGVTNPLTDGLMLLRLALGVRNAPVLSNAVGSDAMRTDWLAISGYLANQCGWNPTP